MPFISMGEIIPKTIKKNDVGRKIEESFSLRKLEKIISDTLGIKIENRLKLLYIKDKNLILACLDDRLELVIKEEKSRIIQKIDEFFGESKIDDLVFID